MATKTYLIHLGGYKFRTEKHFLAEAPRPSYAMIEQMYLDQARKETGHKYPIIRFGNPDALNGTPRYVPVIRLPGGKLSSPGLWASTSSKSAIGKGRSFAAERGGELIFICLTWSAGIRL